MKKDRRGMGGLMESMVAAMIVVVSLTVFMSLVCYVQLGEQQEKDNYGFIETLTISDGKITGDIHDDIVFIVESKDHRGMEIKVTVIGDVEKLSYYDSYGSLRTETVTSEKGTFHIGSDDGRSLLAEYEVIIWD